MAKQLVTWEENNGRLFMNRANALPKETLAIFDIPKIFPMFEKMNPLQKYLTVYGVKQALSDPGGKKGLTAKDKADIAHEKWALFLKGEYKVKKEGAISKAKQLDNLLAIGDDEEAWKAFMTMRKNA